MVVYEEVILASKSGLVKVKYGSNAVQEPHTLTPINTDCDCVSISAAVEKWSLRYHHHKI